jgi:hypothetical protein
MRHRAVGRFHTTVVQLLRTSFTSVKVWDNSEGVGL